MKNNLANLRDRFMALNRSGSMPLPRIIHVETRSQCNGRCHFCPASVTTDARPDQLMPETLVDKIVKELADLDYSNRLSFYNNNEPFLDKRIFDFISLARRALPKAYLELKTNGINLTLDSILKIFNSGLDMLYINDYSDKNVHRKNIEEIRQALLSIRRFGINGGNSHSPRIAIELRDIGEVLGSRAGKSPNKKESVNPYKSKICLRPCEMMTIDPNGDVSVCSEDYDCSIKMGNITQTTLHQVWSSEGWTAIRNRLLNGERSCTTSCSKCDYRGHSMELLEEYQVSRPLSALELGKRSKRFIHRFSLN